MQEYRRGHNEAVLKTVRPKATGVRIPLPAPKIKAPSLRLVLLFLLRYERILTPLCESCARRMGFAFERKPSVSSLTSGGAKNLRQRWIPLFLRHISNSRLIQSYRPAVFFLSLNISRKSLIYKGFFAFVVHFAISGANILRFGYPKMQKSTTPRQGVVPSYR